MAASIVRRLLRRRRRRHEKSHFTRNASSPLSITRDETTKKPLSYTPCLLLPNCSDSDGYRDEISQVCYNFFSLKTHQFIQKKERFRFEEEQYVAPKGARLVGSSNGWLAYFVDDSDSDTYGYNSPVYLTNPSLPLRYTRVFPIQMYCPCINKIALSVTPQQFLFPTLDFSTTIGFLDAKCRVAFTRILDGYAHCYEPYYDNRAGPDLLFFRKHKKFYGLIDSAGDEGLFGAWDECDPRSVLMNTCYDLDKADEKTMWKKLNSSSYRVSSRKYLMESNDCLLLVVRWYACHFFGGHGETPPITVDFEVYEMDFKQQQWKPVSVLDDRALFIGGNESFSLSTQEFPYLIKNAIYFAGRGDVGVFRLNDDSIERIHMGGCEQSCLGHWIMVDIGAV